MRRNHLDIILILWLLLSMGLGSCDSNPHDSHWFEEDNLTIGEYLRTNQSEYSKFFRLLTEGELLITLCGYNPYGEGYTLFLPTDEAISQFIQQSPDYGSFEELVLDTGYLRILTRYHTLNNPVHTREFPNGALTDRTLTGDRLTIGFYTEGDNPVYKVNNAAPIIKSNLEMTNGYIHVISGILQQADKSGYDWLQEQDGYSILAQALELSGIRERIWFNSYTILAEHDSVYHRSGIRQIEDLIDRIASPGIPYSDFANSLYQYSAYHILRGEYYLNDFYQGTEEYRTMAEKRLTIDVGLEICINPGVDTFGIEISGSGDTVVIDYTRPVMESCNILTKTGPVHSISDLLVVEPLPE